MNLKDLLLGPNKYTTGLIFLLANVMGFFSKMNELKVSKHNTFVTLMVIIACGYYLS